MTVKKCSVSSTSSGAVQTDCGGTDLILAKASKLLPKSQLSAWRLECEMLHFSLEKLDFYHALSKLV